MEPPCPHWWIIEEPNGPTSKGVCKLCGAVKEHPNTVDYGELRRTYPYSLFGIYTSPETSPKRLEAAGFHLV
jgi:hypothetical protein